MASGIVKGVYCIGVSYEAPNIDHLGRVSNVTSFKLKEAPVAYIALKTDLGHHYVNTNHIIQIMTSIAGNKWTVFTSRSDTAGQIAVTDVDTIERLKAEVGRDS